MADTGAISPGTMADDSAVGSVSWTNPNNAKVSDNVYATAAVAFLSVSHYLKATNFGFSIPAGATINGILVEVERKGFDNIDFVRDNAIKIVKGGTIGATDKSSLDNWPVSDAYKSYGSSSDLWGETWTAEDINLSTFGFVVSVKDVSNESPGASVDHIRITVYYTETGDYSLTTAVTAISLGGQNTIITSLRSILTSVTNLTINGIDTILKRTGGIWFNQGKSGDFSASNASKTSISAVNSAKTSISPANSAKVSISPTTNLNKNSITPNNQAKS